MGDDDDDNAATITAPLPPRDRPLCESLAQLGVRSFRGDLADGGDVWNELPDALLNRCLWPESGVMLECFAAAHPRAAVLQLLWWIHQTYQAGGPHALWAAARQHDMVGLTSYLVRVHHFHATRTRLEPRHAAFFEPDEAAAAAACCDHDERSSW